MNDDQLKTLDQVRAFLDGTQAVKFSLKTEGYDLIRRTLIRFAYHSLSKPDKGLLLGFRTHVSGYSRVQVKRLANTWLKSGQLRPRSSAGNGFTCKYTDADRRLLAEWDELHGTLSGPATKKLCEHAWRLFELSDYRRLAGISVSHLYNLRRSKIYQGLRRKLDKTHSRASSIGERRKPQPDGQPGYIRVDTVHQGDLDGVNPYINYPRPCFFPATKTNAKGKQVKTYPYEAMMTPYEKFKSLDKSSRYLKPGITLKRLDAIAFSINDNEAATLLKEAKQQLFKTIAEQNHQAA